MAKIWAIIPAAGSGSRMQQSTPKQYLTIASKSVLEHSMEVLFANVDLAALVVCVPEQDNIAVTLIEQNKLLAEYYERQQVVLVTGGASRAQSVLNGLQVLEQTADEQDWVMVHDAARPCVNRQDLKTLCKSLEHDSVGGLLAFPAKDTLKMTSNGRVTSTLSRDEVWHALTPQMFRYGILKEALNTALVNGLAVTDESSALELAGFHPKLIKGSANNIKITVSDDLYFAEQFLA